jgi:glutathione S-transferase
VFLMTGSKQRGGVYTLWGGPLSLCSGKACSYLIKKRIPYRDLYPSHPDFPRRIMPAVGLVVVPILEAPDGTIVQDTTGIIEYLEARHPEPDFVPPSPLQDAAAWLVSAFGSEGLLQAAMHYRWWYCKEQESFLTVEFARILKASGGPVARQAQARAVMQQMNDYLGFLGVTAEHCGLRHDGADRRAPRASVARRSDLRTARPDLPAPVRRAGRVALRAGRRAGTRTRRRGSGKMARAGRG